MGVFRWLRRSVVRKSRLWESSCTCGAKFECAAIGFPTGLMVEVRLLRRISVSDELCSRFSLLGRSHAVSSSLLAAASEFVLLANRVPVMYELLRAR